MSPVSCPWEMGKIKVLTPIANLAFGFERLLLGRGVWLFEL